MTSPVHVGKALQSLRNSDFNTLSSMGEVIDNSLQANAKNVRIRLQKVQISKKKYDITEIAFADDGDGMAVDKLAKCLQLGFSDRYNDRKGIGRFGVGMTLGAITQCTRIEVYSKPRGGGWNFTYIDLDEMKDEEDSIIPQPRQAEIPREYANLMEDYGTLVIWKNLDREDATIQDMKIWIGRTYRKFIGEEIIREENDKSKIIKNPNRRHIFLDDGDVEEEISALDPLYVTKTKYNDTTTDIEAPIILSETVSKIDPPPTRPTAPNTITIRMSLVPKAWRPKQGSGMSEENRKRQLPSNEGISILRNNREVFYGHIPYYKITDKRSSHYKGFIDMDRFWGCEISFNAEMDHWFSIKNIKVGARPISELRDQIQKRINSTIHDFRAEIREDWDDNRAEKQKAEGKVLGGAGEVEDSIRKKTKDKDLSDPDIDEMITDAGIKEEKKRREIKEKLANQPVVFEEHQDLAKGSPFLDITTRGAKSIICMNMKHPFFRKFVDLHQSVLKASTASDKDLEALALDIDIHMHTLLASFALARKELDLEDRDVYNTMEKLMINWTLNLASHDEINLEK